MELINSLDEYKCLIQNNKRRFSKVVTNFMLMSSTIEKYIIEKRLFAQEYENGLAMYVDESEYYNLYYFWRKNTPLDNFRKEKPVLIEQIYNIGSKDTFLEETEPILLAAGFENFRNNLQVEADFKGRETFVEQEYARRLACLNDIKLAVQTCDDQETMRQAFWLWKNYLDPTDIPRDHYTLKHDDTILNVLDRSGKVAATIWFRVKGKTSECRHTVTHPDYYQKGLATALSYGWLKYSINQGASRWLTWISEDNFRSLATYGKMGFRANGKASKQYILK